jgi:hypothetical protein
LHDDLPAGSLHEFRKKTEEFALKHFYSKFALAKKGADSVAQQVEHSA